MTVAHDRNTAALMSRADGAINKDIALLEWATVVVRRYN
jgi:hypothetical protein